MQPPVVLLIGDCGTGKSTIYEKLVMESGHSSASQTSQTSVWLANESPDRKVVVIDTPGQDVLTDPIENNEQIAMALRYPAGISLILLTAKADQRLESIKTQVEDYIEQLCDCDCTDILCVAVTHMDSDGIKWSRDDVKRMLRRQFGLRAVVFSGFNQDRDDLLQQVLTCASPEPRNLSAASEDFEEMFTISHDKVRALKSINDLVALFVGRSTRLVSLATERASDLGPDGLAELIFELKKSVDLQIAQANDILRESNGWHFDGEARERYEQAGYLAYFKQVIHQKLESAVGTVECLTTAQPHLVRACPHCGCAQLASTAYVGGYGWSYSSAFSGLTCGGHSNSSVNQQREKQRQGFSIQCKFFDAAATEVDFISPEKLPVEVSHGCGQYVRWEDMKQVQLPREKVQELEKEAIRLLEGKATDGWALPLRSLMGWDSSSSRESCGRNTGGGSGDGAENSQAESSVGYMPQKAKDDAKCGAEVEVPWQQLSRQTLSRVWLRVLGKHSAPTGTLPAAATSILAPTAATATASDALAPASAIVVDQAHVSPGHVELDACEIPQDAQSVTKTKYLFGFVSVGVCSWLICLLLRDRNFMDCTVLMRSLVQRN